MPLGKEIAAYTGQLITITIRPASGTAKRVEMNLEGTFAGEPGAGTYLETMHVELEAYDAAQGTWTLHGFAEATDGTLSVSYTGEGTWEKVGQGKWKYRGINRYSNGLVTAHEFEGDLATRTWTGRHYEWN